MAIKESAEAFVMSATHKFLFNFYYKLLRKNGGYRERIKKLMHHLYSSIIFRKCIIILLNKSIYCIYIKSANVFL